MAKVPSANDPLGWLDQVDDSLKKVTTYLDTIFEDIESCPQATVDYLCECAGEYASYVLEYGKIKVLNGLGTQKKAIQDILDQYGALSSAMAVIENPGSIDALVGWAANVVKVIKIMYEIVVKPYKEAIEFIIKMTNKIISISNSMQQIASYTPPKAPDVNFNKFKIDFKPFTIGDIGENLPYPDPPQVKPFPNPFTDTIKMAQEMKKSNQQNNSTTA